MKRCIPLKKAMVAMWVVLGVLAVNSAVFADARTAYLIKMLEDGASYRVRVQAAQTLGTLNNSDSIPALIAALRDESEPVVIAVVVALGKLEATEAVPVMRRRLSGKGSKAIKSQIRATLADLESKGQGDEVDGVPEGGVAYLVKVDSMGNNSSSVRKDVASVMRRVVAKTFAAQREVTLQQKNWSPKKVNRMLAKQAVKGLIVSGSLIELKSIDNTVKVKMALNVFSNPGYNLVMMPAGEVTIPVSGDLSDPVVLRNAEDKAIKALIAHLVAKVLDAAPDVL